MSEFYPSIPSFGNTVVIPLMVDPSTSPPSLIAPPLGLPLGQWVVIWNLTTLGLAAAGDPIATFDPTAGIALAAPPPNVGIVNLGLLSPTQWGYTIDSAAVKASIYSYTVTYDYLEQVAHDPSILVTNDPVEIPPTS